MAEDLMTQELAILQPDKIGIVLADLPSALQKNKESVEKATGAGLALLTRITEGGMTAELDAECNNILVKFRNTSKSMNERRTPFTKIFDMIKGEFTEQENLLSTKNKDSIYSRIQAARDEFATQLANEQKKREQEAARKLAVEKEKINMQADFTNKLNQHFLSFLQSAKVELNNFFERLTLDSFDSGVKMISEYPTTYDYNHFNGFAPAFTFIYLKQEDCELVLTEVKKGKYGTFNSQYASDVTSFKNELLDKVSSKKTELIAIAESKRKAEEAAKAAEQAKTKAAKAAAEEAAKVAAAESERLAQEQAKRKADEELRMKEEAAKAAAAAESTVAANKQASMTEALFDAQQTVTGCEQASGQVRESCEIEVLNPLGYLLIAQFYFEQDGKSEDVSKLEKKTLGSMKKFCESYAMKHDVKIESAFLKYNEKFKTVAKKA